ncbi:MAG TPA: hypothetical protein PK280_13120 [Planctomycetota bacterium]|nr:hypothetical protein [Planctomycetota bacterium]
MEESISRLVRQFAQSPAGSAAREEARSGLVAGARIITESLLELASSQNPDLRSAALSALADIVMSIHQASFTARHMEAGTEGVLGRTVESERCSEGARLFGEVAISRGLTKVEDVLRALNIQKREVLAGLQPRLIGEILVSEGALTSDQVKTVLMAIRGRLLKGIEEQLASAEKDEV